MSDTLGNTPSHINISAWLEVIKVGISVPCSLYRLAWRDPLCLCVTHPSGRAIVGLLWKSLSAAGHRGDQKPEKVCSLCWEKCVSLLFYFLEWSGAGRAGRFCAWEVSVWHCHGWWELWQSGAGAVCDCWKNGFILVDRSYKYRDPVKLVSNEQQQGFCLSTKTHWDAEKVFTHDRSKHVNCSCVFPKNQAVSRFWGFFLRLFFL